MALTINRTPITPRPLVFNTVSGPIASCNNAKAGKAKQVLCSINPVQSGSGDPSPSNVRPISGFTGLNLCRTGKNLLNDVNPDTKNGYLTTLGIFNSNANNRSVIVSVKPSTTYTYTWNRGTVVSGSDDSNIALFDSYPTFGSTGTLTGTNMGKSGSKRTFTTSASNRYAVIKICNITKTDFSTTLSASMLELGSTATAYEAYQGETKTASDSSGVQFSALSGTNNVWADTGDVSVSKVITVIDGEALTASDIGQDGYSVAEYLTPAVTGVLLKGTNGSSLTFGTLDTPYVISANPFVSTITASDLNGYWAIPRYVPMELNVLEADPSTDIGDIVLIKPMVDEVVLLANVYNEIFVDSNLEAYALNAPQYSIPLMERQLQFIGGIRAKYVATGNEVREADISNTEYNATVSAKIAEENIDKSLTQQEVFNRLTNNGQAQGIFLDSNGDLYINGTWIQAHTISADKISVTDLSAFNATIGAFTIDSDSIYSGTKGSGTANGDITLTTSTFSRSIGGTDRSNLKFAIGGNFGVAQDGSVYMSNATITSGLVNITSTSATVSALSVDYTYSGNQQNYMSMLSASQITHKVTASNGSYDLVYLNKDALVFGAAGANGSNYAEYGSYLSDGWGIADHSGHGLFMQCPTNAYIYMQPVQVASW